MHYATRQGHRLQDILVCIRHRTTLEGSTGLRRPNSELFLKSAREMAALFPEYPEAIRHTLYLAEQCHLDLDFTPLPFPPLPVTPGAGPRHLSGSTVLGQSPGTLRGPDGEVRARLREELEVNFPCSKIIID
ncbi:MAG TPA: hypothetical protein GX513_15490 [Firmicutes bacterium]|nr:hypothetical protein [Bacillota bacterium]